MTGISLNIRPTGGCREPSFDFSSLPFSFLEKSNRPSITRNIFDSAHLGSAASEGAESKILMIEGQEVKGDLVKKIFQP